MNSLRTNALAASVAIVNSAVTGVGRRGGLERRRPVRGALGHVPELAWRRQPRPHR
jgi:hypothetical protein